VVSTTTVLLIAVLVPSVILHEVAHGVVALGFGDDTAKRAGRLTLNPLPHVDPFGTILLPALLALSGAGVIGWAKPVPVVPSRLRDPRRQLLWVSLAGPATNLLLSLAAALALRAFDPHGDVRLALVLTGVVNVVLAVFNLLPVPPFDGSALVERFLPARVLPAWHRARRWSMGVVLAVILLAPRALDGVFGWAIDRWAGLL
jgi:Zn-dependent protease